MGIKTAFAGTLESGDILIEISPGREEGIDITLTSPVIHQFGEQIKKIIIDTLTELDVTNVSVNATDKGALDCTIKARVTAAICRATDKDIWE